MAEMAVPAGGDRKPIREALLDGKLTPPTRRNGGVSRESVIADARAADARIVDVSAPAGFGKSTLLAEWAATEDRPIAWVSVDRFDDDPAGLLTLIATACAPVSPSAAEAVDMRGASMLGRSAPMPAAALTAAPEPFVLFLDDIHHARSNECEDVLEVVLGGIPNGSQAVLASRQELRYLARLRVGGAVVDIGPGELSIDGSGARTIFAETGAVVTDDELTAAVDRCEGWAAGLFLCALAARDGGDALAVASDGRRCSRGSTPRRSLRPNAPLSSPRARWSAP